MKKIFLTILATFSILGALAQTEAGKQQNRHEIWLGGGGGISSLQYSPSIGDHNTGYGYLGGLGYTYYINYNWGISIGGEYQYLQARYNLSNTSDVGPGSDVLDSYLVPFPNSGEVFLFNVSPRSRLRERQEVAYINIPLIARYQIDLPGKNRVKNHKLSFGAGLKTGIPIKGSYYTSSSFETTGIDWVTRDEYTNMPNHGFGTYTYEKTKFDWKQKINFAGTIEAGVKWQFNPKWGLYTGLFADFGLNDIVKDRPTSDNYYVQYNPTGKPYAINTIVKSDYGWTDGTNGGQEIRRSIVDKVHTFSAGIKIAATFGFKPFDKKEKVKTVAPYEDPWDKPVTGKQMRELLKEQTGDLTEAQKEEFEKLKQFLSDELKQPDLSAPVYCFDFDRDNIPADMRAVLDHKAELLKKYPSLSLTIEGHTDSAGSDKYNYGLGLRRADAVKYYLVSKGISGSRLTVTSKGRKEPIIKNTQGNEKANCPNRRVEFILKK
ncbi:MAG: OmpA family protein [Dysgonamonadaceae bacterium]|jgi:outer membrane protein OmpA-like peptidoglycan-associated protein|nr:OmpA family protein [Dysgonamonadaceae bacterium]